jgi:hypothetical protein
MRAAPRSEPVREPDEVLLIYGVEHLDDSPLDDLVLQRGDTERPEPPVCLRDVHPPRRLRPVGTTVGTAEQVFEVGSQALPVGVPSHLVNTWCSLRVVRHIGGPQASQVDVVQQCGEPCFFVPSCYLAHTVQPCFAAQSGTEPGTCRPVRVPLGQLPFLHHLRSRCPGLVRRLRRYYGAVRLPMLVHLRLTA